MAQIIHDYVQGEEWLKHHTKTTQVSGKYDLIGDIHGCCRTLETLLDKLGYHQENGIFQHPDRKVIFLGDFVDRGDYQRDVVQVARSMVEGGHALISHGQSRIQCHCLCHAEVRPIRSSSTSYRKELRAAFAQILGSVS